MRAGLANRMTIFAYCAGMALSLTACGRDPYVTNGGTDFAGAHFSGSNWRQAGNWKIETEIDRITGAPSSSAYVKTRQSSNGSIYFPQPAVLQIGCLDKDAVVRIAFDFKIGTTRQSLVGYRFDEKPGHETDARITPDHQTVVLEDRNQVAQFVRELRTSKSLYVRIRSLNAARTSAEFAVEGAPEAIDSALARCPAAPLTEPPRHAALR